MIVLVGFMGAGKTTVGTLLAAKLGLPFTDSDQVIEEQAGKPIRQIFADILSLIARLRAPPAPA